MKIGFVGLGNMGTGMANNILKNINNKSDLFVFTRTLDKIKNIFKNEFELIYRFKLCYIFNIYLT